jgi:hypothetical protein
LFRVIDRLARQVACGLAVALPAAVRQAVLPPAARAVGSTSDPAGPSRMLSWNVWLNSTAPAAARAPNLTAPR